MANPPCQFDDGNAAVFIGTNFDTGESVTLCPPCLVSWCATIVEGMTGVPVSALIDAARSGELGSPPQDTTEDSTSEDSTEPADTEHTAQDGEADDHQPVNQ